MKRYIAGIGLCCALAACNESYPGLYAPVYDADNPNPEMTADSIPVTLSLTDPAYALVTGKRGQGSFGFWDDEEERAKWMAAEFGVYAFLTRNHVYDGTPDLTADETSTGGDAPLCLGKRPQSTDFSRLRTVMGRRRAAVLQRGLPGA